MQIRRFGPRTCREGEERSTGVAREREGSGMARERRGRGVLTAISIKS
jgi:hypothetical protein